MKALINYQVRIHTLPGIGGVATKLVNVTRLAPPKLTSEGGR